MSRIRPVSITEQQFHDRMYKCLDVLRFAMIIVHETTHRSTEHEHEEVVHPLLVPILSCMTELVDDLTGSRGTVDGQLLSSLLRLEQTTQATTKTGNVHNERMIRHAHAIRETQYVEEALGERCNEHGALGLGLAQTPQYAHRFLHEPLPLEQQDRQ